uniref:Myelin-oligodendrocyte glycoprotein-like n=1 Tax=Phascolarctos cinereus TaxID=38626 RepID=A0A6P5KZA8_PHACI|nr:myelin-oligodendrocyte glycoprotein-like [Phascolarctos cinereus]
MDILNLSGSFLSSFVIAFILLLQKPTLASGQFSVIGPARPIQASVGGEAELPCYLSPPQSAQHMEVIWFQSTRVVHHYRDGEDLFGDQAPTYHARTELVRDAITNGNVTLKIQDMRLLDAGKYKCLFEDGFHQEEAEMELTVSGEETVSQILPPIYFVFIFIFCVVLYLTFLLWMLRIQDKSEPQRKKGLLRDSNSDSWSLEVVKEVNSFLSLSQGHEEWYNKYWKGHPKDEVSLRASQVSLSARRWKE